MAKRTGRDLLARAAYRLLFDEVGRYRADGIDGVELIKEVWRDGDWSDDREIDCAEPGDDGDGDVGPPTASHRKAREAGQVE